MGFTEDWVTVHHPELTEQLATSSPTRLATPTEFNTLPEDTVRKLLSLLVSGIDGGSLVPALVGGVTVGPPPALVGGVTTGPLLVLSVVSPSSSVKGVSLRYSQSIASL